jgi:hypothetical protein
LNVIWTTGQLRLPRLRLGKALIRAQTDASLFMTIISCLFHVTGLISLVTRVVVIPRFSLHRIDLKR